MALKVFEEQKERMKRYYQEGMLKAKDVPSHANMKETKKSLGLALKSDLKEALEMFSSTMIECLTGIEKIFCDPMNLDESELKTMDLILGSKIILQFFRGLSTSDDGLMELIEGLRVWECSAPLVKKNRLNTLIIGLKNLKEPLMANTIIMMLREGLPSRMDNLIDHLMITTTKTMGPLNIIPVAPWQALSSKSSLEIGETSSEMSSTSVVNPIPLATSSAIDARDPSQSSATREALNKLRERLRTAPSALDQP